MKVVAWWLVLISFAASLGQPDNPANNGLTAWLLIGWIVFGIWRVVKRRREGRAERPLAPDES